MVKIIITGDTPLEALATAAAFGMHCMGNKEVCDAGYRIHEAEQYKEQKASAEAAEKKAAEENDDTAPPAGESSKPAEKPIDTPKPKPEPTPVPEPDDAPTYTLEQIREKGIAAGRKYGNAAVKAILKELGASGMGALDAAKYPKFVEKLDALDASGGGNA